MPSPIGRPPVTGGVGPAREAAREESRESERAGRRRDGVGRPAADPGDRVTLSPLALRGLGSEEPGGEGAGASEGGDAAATAFRDGSEALLAARGLSFVLQADPAGAARAHDGISTPRAIALLRA